MAEVHELACLALGRTVYDLTWVRFSRLVVQLIILYPFAKTQSIGGAEMRTWLMRKECNFKVDWAVRMFP